MVPLTPMWFKDDSLYLYPNIFCNVLCPSLCQLCTPVYLTANYYTVVVSTPHFLCYWLLRAPCLFFANWCKWESVALLFRRLAYPKVYTVSDALISSYGVVFSARPQKTLRLLWVKCITLPTDEKMWNFWMPSTHPLSLTPTLFPSQMKTDL